MADFLIPINVKLRMKNIEESEIESYLTDFIYALDSMCYSNDENDDHFGITAIAPDYTRIVEVMPE